MNKDNLASFGIGIGVGLLIGGILGILYAPKSGTETRQIIKDKAVELKEKAKELPAKARAFVGKGRIEDVKPR